MPFQCEKEDAIMQLCREKYHWEYLPSHKETRQKTVDESYEWIKRGEDAEKKEGLCLEKGTGWFGSR